MDVDGNRSPQSYSDTSSLSFTYTPKLTEDVGAIFYGDWERRGKIYWDAQNQYKTAPASTFDAKAGLTYKNYELSFFMRNISNKRFPVLFQANAAGQGVHGQLLNMPRTYGVELRAKF
jgi:iron complex outermembrane receptor protein